MSKVTLSLASALSIAAIGLAPAHAGDFEFRYQQHELASAAGAAVLFKRLETRVESYCTSAGRRPLSQRIAEKECIDGLMEETVQKIQHPYIDRMYASMTNKAA